MFIHANVTVTVFCDILSVIKSENEGYLILFLIELK